MKNFFLAFFAILLSGMSFTQTLDCITAPPEGVTAEAVQSGNLGSFARTTITPPLRLAIHVIRPNDGTGGISTQMLDDKLNELYEAFEPVLFEFEVHSINYHNNSGYYWINNSFEADLLRSEINIFGCINVYFVNELWYDGYFLNGLSSFSPRGGNYEPQGIIIWNGAPLSTLPHEMGHFFDLFHTFELAFGAENIARSGGCANYSNAGDLLYDTPADPTGRMQASGINHLNCQWDPKKTPPVDGCGQNNYSPLTDNYMITEVPACRSNFTQHQKSRMNETLTLYRPELLEHLVYLQNVNGVDQSYLNGTFQFGNQTVYSGSYITAPSGNYNLRTNTERFTNMPGGYSTLKHHNWNYNIGDFKLEKLITLDDDTDQKAFYRPLKYVKIESYIEEYLVPGVGTFEFQDPWYVMQDGSQPGTFWIQAVSEYEPTGKYGATQKGVFLNQDYSLVNNPYYSLKSTIPSIISLQSTGKSHSTNFLGWKSLPTAGADFQSPNSLTTAVNFKNEGTITYASYKLSQLTNISSAYENSGQRHLGRRAYNGDTYNVYESMGYIWLEKSTDNGSTWTLANNAAPLSAGVAKSPSLDFCTDHLLIVYQEKTSSGYLRIKLKLYDVSEDEVIDSAVVMENNNVDFSFDTQPVIADYYSTGRFMVIYRNNMDHDPFYDTGLHYDYGVVAYDYQTYSYHITDLNAGNDLYISGTNSKSVNPSVSTTPSGLQHNIHLVWQQGLESESISHILYQKIQWNGSGFTFPAQVNVSNGCGYTKNYKPSITSITSDDIPRVAWIGYLYDAQGEMGKTGSTSGTQTQTIYRETVFRALDNPSSWSYGSNVVHANINRLEGTPGYAIAWAQENGSGYQNKLMRNTNFYSEYLLNTTGSAIELNNAGLFSNMFGYALHTGSAPYYFGKSQFVNTLQKEQLNNMTAARSGVLYSGNAQFMFSFGDISVNNAPVFFPVIPDTMRLTGLDELKQYLVSDPFMLENQTGFMYSVQYRAVDTGSCSAALGAEGEVNFRLVLEDSNSGVVLGEYDNITFTQNDLTKYDNISYEVNTAGIGSRLVRLRLIPYTTAELTPSLITRVRSAEEQAKGSLKRIHYNGAEPVKDYSLTQNYPNPFNPVTMIEFALPEQSDISLKVYDILGKEIATLAAGSYSAGRYTVPFDGTSHASGVYICKLSYGKGQSITRKMTLLK